MPPSLVEAIRPGWRKPHSQLDAVVKMNNVQRFDLVGELDDTFAQAEADREIAQVLRRAHHHRIGAAVVGQGDRGLFGNGTRTFAEADCAPDLTINDAARIVHPYSAACIDGAIRRASRGPSP